MLRPDGTFLSTLVEWMGPSDPNLTPTDTILIPRVRFDLTGSVIDTLAWEVRFPPRPADVRTIRVGPREIVLPRISTDETWTISASDGRFDVHHPRSASGSASEIRVVHLALDGDTLYDTRVPYRPEPFPAALIDSLIGRAVAAPNVIEVA